MVCSRDNLQSFAQPTWQSDWHKRGEANFITGLGNCACIQVVCVDHVHWQVGKFMHETWVTWQL